MRDGSVEIAEAVNHLVDDYRHRCLWFLRPDYYPVTDEERVRVTFHEGSIRGAFPRVKPS